MPYILQTHPSLGRDRNVDSKAKGKNNFAIPAIAIKTRTRTACAVFSAPRHPTCPDPPTQRAGSSHAWRAFKGGQSPREEELATAGLHPPARRGGRRVAIRKGTAIEKDGEEPWGTTALCYTQGRCHPQGC